MRTYVRAAMPGGVYFFTVNLAERRSRSRLVKSERGIWQRRYWEHLIRDDEDYRRHIEYIHYNPVKHGYVTEPRLWPYSSFGRWVSRGEYSDDWGSDGSGEMAVLG